ncbi:MAG: 6-bladed beta-propeller [Flavobacteriaceae bacterium]|nr:6-bladed beta-propeller [Flavobacteriaceae bacterium]
MRSIIYLIFAIFSFLSACSPKLNQSTSKSIIYPPPPDAGRIQYLTSISTSKDVVKQSAFSKSIVGEDKVQSILKPYGVFVRNGKMYVCDVNIAGLEIIDLENKEFNYFIPKDQYQLKLPLNIYVDKNDQLYIADITLQKIMVFDKNKEYVTSFGKKENLKPTDVFVKGDKIWVVDSGNHRVNVYNRKTYAFDFYFPKSEQDDESYLFKPTNIFVSENKVYVTDMAGSNVKIYTHKGEYLSSVGKYGDRIGDFVRPKGVAVDKEENLYVVDASFENVQIFDKDGKLLLYFGGAYKGPGGMWLPVKVRIDYDNLQYFQEYVDPKYDLEYLIYVTNQFGPDKVSVYGRIRDKYRKEIKK